MKRQSLYFIAPQQVELRANELAAPAAGELQVLALYSAISAGTEMLLYRGEAPSALQADSNISALQGNLACPLKYGYSMVGRVSALGAGADSAWQDRLVFAFNPHETAFNPRPEDLQPLPAGVEAQDAAFLANMETAVNLILDGEPRLGERVVVLGQGVVGLLTTALLAQHPLGALLTLDDLPHRRQHSAQMGAQHTLASDELTKARSLLGPRGADLVYELSGDPVALDTALALVGPNGRVVVGSWYGQRRAPIDLGGHFHRGRIKLISSQVSNIGPALSGRWDRARRFDVAWQHLGAIQPSRLVSHRFPFAQAPEAYALLASASPDVLGVLFTYQ
jgi:2-desacetyl-2-hydroxyethyl bacteriochlorophyllide A dehydrogenase